MYRIEDIPFFAHLPNSYRDILIEKMFVKEYTAKSIVFFEGDTSHYMYIVLEGSVKMYKTTPKGRQIHINILKAPSLIGEYVYFEKLPFPASCEFITDGTIGLIPFEVVEKLLEQKEFSKAIIRSLTSKISLLSTLVHKETVLSSEAKVADIILHNISIFDRLKNSEISSILNLTPETLSRILAKFKKEKVIAITHNSLEILDNERLKTILETNKMKECTNCIMHFKEQHNIKD